MIKIKEKPCKAIGKAKGFQGCETLSLKRTYGLCPSCYAKWLLSTPEGQEKLNKSVLAATKPRRDFKKAEKEHKEQKSIQALLVTTRHACHNYIRLRDQGKPCVSCDTPWQKGFHAGHWKKAEIYSNLKFDERNIHGQCERCNIFLDGNVQEYGNRIQNRIGDQGKKVVEDMSKSFKAMDWKWDREQLKAIRKYYQEKLKELKKSLHLD